MDPDRAQVVFGEEFQRPLPITLNVCYALAFTPSLDSGRRLPAQHATGRRETPVDRIE